MSTARKNIILEDDIENNLKSIQPIFEGDSGLRDLLLNEIQSMYYIKKTLLKILPKMTKNACSFELIESLTKHHEVTRLQIVRLEDVFLILNEKPLLQRFKPIEYLINQLDSVVENTKFGTVRDTGIVLNLHKVAHFEIATYNLLTIFTENTNQNIIYDLLFLSLNEEKIAEMRLTKIANSIRFHTSEILV